MRQFDLANGSQVENGANNDSQKRIDEVGSLLNQHPYEQMSDQRSSRTFTGISSGAGSNKRFMSFMKNPSFFSNAQALMSPLHTKNAFAAKNMFSEKQAPNWHLRQTSKDAEVADNISNMAENQRESSPEDDVAVNIPTEVMSVNTSKKNT